MQRGAFPVIPTLHALQIHSVATGPDPDRPSAVERRWLIPALWLGTDFAARDRSPVRAPYLWQASWTDRCRCGAGCSSCRCWPSPPPSGILRAGFRESLRTIPFQFRWWSGGVSCHPSCPANSITTSISPPSSRSRQPSVAVPATSVFRSLTEARRRLRRCGRPSADCGRERRLFTAPKDTDERACLPRGAGDDRAAKRRRGAGMPAVRPTLNSTNGGNTIGTSAVELPAGRDPMSGGRQFEPPLAIAAAV